MATSTIERALAPSDVVNNLTSTATDKPLSAAQGKTLNDKLTMQTISVSSASGSYKLSNGYKNVLNAFMAGYIVTTHYSTADGGSTWAVIRDIDTMNAVQNVSGTLYYTIAD